MHDFCQVTAIIQNHVGRPSVGAFDCLVNAPFIFFFRFALPCENRNARGGNRGGGMVLR